MNTMRTFITFNWGKMLAFFGVFGALISVGVSLRDFTSQLESLQSTVAKQDVRLNGHDDDIKEIKLSMSNLKAINDNIKDIREKAANLSLRMNDIEKLVKIIDKVETDSKRIDGLELKLQLFKEESIKDRATLNSKLDSVLKSLETLIGMHMTR